LWGGENLCGAKKPDRYKMQKRGGGGWGARGEGAGRTEGGYNWGGGGGKAKKGKAIKENKMNEGTH